MELEELIKNRNPEGITCSSRTPSLLSPDIEDAVNFDRDVENSKIKSDG